MTNFSHSPVEGGGRLTSDFGPRRAPRPGASTNHRGIDLAAPTGTRVESFVDGTVVFAGRMGGYGNVVFVDHGNGFVTRYGHLHRISVRVGDRVTSETKIGEVGNTGNSTGPHLHFEIRKDGVAINPLPYIRGQRFLPGGRIVEASSNPAPAERFEEHPTPQANANLVREFRSTVREHVEYRVSSRGLRNDDWREGLSERQQAYIESEMKRLGLSDVNARNQMIDQVYSTFLNRTPLSTDDYRRYTVAAKAIGYLSALVDRFRPSAINARWDREDFGVPPSTRSPEIGTSGYSPRREVLELLVGQQVGFLRERSTSFDAFNLGQFNSDSLTKRILTQLHPTITPADLDVLVSSGFSTPGKFTPVSRPHALMNGSYVAVWIGPDLTHRSVWIESGVVYSASHRHGEVVKYTGERAAEFLAKAEAGGARFYRVGSELEGSALGALLGMQPR